MGEQIGLFGGTFNPVHVGHLKVARAAVDQLRLEELRLIPSAMPPHKTPADLAPGEHRLAMCRLAVRGEPRLSVDDVELRAGGRSYTVETLRTLRSERPGAELVLLIGADMLRELHRWHRAREILEMARVVTARRPDVSLGRLEALRRELGDESADRLLRDVLETPLVDVSSTEVRRRARAGEPIEPLVPETVARYIHEHNLYR